jgi:hypothetical protein
MKFTPLPAALLALGLASVAVSTPAFADPAAGLGLSLSFGHGGSAPKIGVGMRVFSSDKEGDTAATIGIDYVIGDNAWRPTVGAAHLFEDSYLGADLGLTNGDLDFGVNGGWQNTLDD